MTSARWEQLKELLDQALAVPEDERVAFVERAAAGDHALRDELLSLLAPAGDTSFLRPPMPSPAAAEGDLAGRRLGPFELVSELGRGGMGIVYLARQSTLDRLVAVKLLPASPVLPERTIARFQREARAAGRLSHPGLTPVYDVGHDDGVHWFAMEYVPGHDLRREIELQGAGEEDVSPQHPILPPQSSSQAIAAVVAVVRDVARALEHAHAHGVVHRDVKPHNVLLDRTGHPHLVDFGLARDESFGTLTRSGDLAGTPHYMSPEQARSDSARVDHRTDIFSLGVVLFELLTLRRPFEGRTSRDVLHRISLGEPPSLRGLNVRVPRDLANVCGKALAKDPDKRYLTAGALADDLDRFLRHEAVLARPENPLAKLGRAMRRHQLPTAAAVAMVLVGVAWWAADAHADERHRGEQVALLEGLLEQPDWSGTVVLEQLVAARSSADRLALELPQRHHGRAVLSLFSERLDALRADWLERGPLVLRRRFAPYFPETGELGLPGPPGDDRRLALVSVLFPDDDALQQRLTMAAMDPRVVVSTDAPAAQVMLRPLDPITGQPGEPIDLGPAPVDSRVTPGYYRIVVSAPGHRAAELTRLLRVPFSTTNLRAVLRSADDPIDAGMVAIPGGTWLRPESDGNQSPDPMDLVVSVDSFLLDRDEVSIGEYRAYLAATGTPPPAAWPAESGWDAAWDALPATGMTWDQARAYAEWAGKRLPSHYEWELAARGAEARSFPWAGDTPPPGPAPTLTGRPASPYAPLADRWAHFTSHAAPVAATTVDLTPEGVMHLLGNVQEWAESPVVFQPSGDGVRSFKADHRWAMGSSYGQPPESDLAQHFMNPVGPGTGQLQVGFRCALSPTP